MEKLGGKKHLKLFLKGGEDLVDGLSGNRESQGLPELVQKKHGRDFRVEMAEESCPPAPDLYLQLSRAIGQRPGAGRDDPSLTALLDFAPDVVAFSLSADLTTWAGQFTESMSACIRLIKRELQAHVIFLNCSSVDPNDTTSNFHEVETPVSLKIHRLNRALIGLSYSEGISIVDADRIVGELGGQDHVADVASYSSQASLAICSEFLRVMQDYGFFQNRPLVMQIGAQDS